MTNELRRPTRKRTTPPAGPRPAERLARMESQVDAIQHALDVQLKRMAMMQAELDSIRRKMGS
jgi:hypothetical protein